jgi:hypothetical protein
MIKKIFLVMAVFLYMKANADGILFSWSPTDLTGMTKEKFDNAKKWTTKDILNKNLETISWPDTYLLLIAANQYKDDKDFIKDLIKQLGNNSEVKLQLTRRLIIWERITHGDILFEGKGMQIDDDLFKVAGRANFILRNITKHNFGLIAINSTTNDLNSLQTKWLEYVDGKKVEEYKKPFESKEKGLDEIKSLSALEALIYSLKSSIEKEALTKTCLKNIYNLDEMPKEKGSSASYCDPDTYTFSLLGILTGDKTFDEKKNYEWWLKWWEENKEKLTWNKEKGIFEVVR